MKVRSSLWSSTRRGESHAGNHIPNQDCCLGVHFSWGDLITLADGVGSCPNSQIGSHAACMAAAKAVDCSIRHNQNDFSLILPLMHSFWRIFLGTTAPDSARTTCLIAFTWMQNLHIAAIGDGMIAVCGNTADETIVLEEDKEDSFSNVTDALDSSFDISCWRTTVMKQENWRGIILCSDGISEDFRPETRPLWAWSVLKTFSSMPAAQRRRQLQKMLKHNAPGHFDDKTLIALCWETYEGN